MLSITNLDYIENLEYEVKIFHSYGGNATSLSMINGFAQGINYASVIAKSEIITISLLDFNFSKSYSSVSSTAT